MNQYALFRWRGDYGGKKQLWFPANYVEELPSSPVRELDEAVSSAPEHVNTFCIFNPQQSPSFFLPPQSTENSPLGTFLKGFIDVTSCHVGELPMIQQLFCRALISLRLCVCVVVHKDGKNSRPYVFTIHSQHFSSQPVQSLDVSADSLDQLINWVTKIREAAQNADARVRV